MTRIRLLSEDERDPALGPVFARFDGDPPGLYKALANAPALLEPYSRLAQALRFETSTPRALREMLILRVALRNGSDYEWTQHRRMAEAAGVPAPQIRALKDWSASGEFSAAERAALALADEFHEGAVSDATAAALASHFNQREVVELLMTAGLYEALARIIQACDLPLDPGLERFLGSP